MSLQGKSAENRVASTCIIRKQSQTFRYLQMRLVFSQGMRNWEIFPGTVFKEETGLETCKATQLRHVNNMLSMPYASGLQQRLHPWAVFNGNVAFCVNVLSILSMVFWQFQRKAITTVATKPILSMGMNFPIVAMGARDVVPVLQQLLITLLYTLVQTIIFWWVFFLPSH